MDGRHQSGAMRALLHLAQGDAVEITDALGRVHAYRVVSRETTPWDQLDRSLFTTAGPPRLALITCGGTFDAGSGRYLDNVVVLAEPLPSTSSP
jgi:sortase (surface protein transpeptidase)